jgi:hypothetical protein
MSKDKNEINVWLVIYLIILIPIFINIIHFINSGAPRNLLIILLILGTLFAIIPKKIRNRADYLNLVGSTMLGLLALLIILAVLFMVFLSGMSSG